ncbi:MAG: Glutaredoxin 3 [Marteilia pararefringens]
MIAFNKDLLTINSEPSIVLVLENCEGPALESNKLFDMIYDLSHDQEYLHFQFYVASMQDASQLCEWELKKECVVVIEKQAVTQKFEEDNVLKLIQYLNRVNVEETIKKLIKSHQLLLFMKGSPNHPKCGYSKTVIEILSNLNLKFDFFDILSNQTIREGLKVYNDWFTYPQLFCNGEFVGGHDIIVDLHKSGSLKKELNLE